MLRGTPRGARRVPRAGGAVNSAGEQVMVLPWLCGRFDIRKKPAGPGGGSLEGAEQGPGPFPGAESRSSIPGPSSPRQQQQQQERAAEENFAEWLLFKNNFAFVSRSGLLQIE